MRKSEAGKGDLYRQVDRTKYESEYDRIFKQGEKDMKVVSYDEKSLKTSGDIGTVVANVVDDNGKQYTVEISGNAEAIKAAIAQLSDGTKVKTTKPFKMEKKVGDNNE